MITFLPESHDDVVAARANGQLTHEDYEQLRGRVEQAIHQHGDVRLLLELGDDFHGWTAGAAWDDLKMGLRHFNRFERCALVGNKSWEQWMARLAKPFFRVEYFDRSQLDEARRWLEQPIGTIARPWIEDVTSFIRRHPVPTALVALGVGFLVFRSLRSSNRHAMIGR